MSRQFPLLLPHETAMGADDFLPADSNREAVAWVKRWPDWPQGGLVLCGDAGSGKSHLLSLWLSQSRGSLLTEIDLIPADMPSRLPPRAAIAIDNADRYAGDHHAETLFFNIYNVLKERQGLLLLTMRRPPAQARFLLPDLRSRLITLPVATLGAPDDTLIAALIVKQFRDRQIELDEGVVDYLTKRGPRDAAGIAELVERLDRAALAQGGKIGLALARRVLEEDA